MGYRVKSKRGAQFRIWANKVLKQYLLQGYAINERIASQKFDELSQLVKVLGRTIQNQEKLTEDSRSLLNVVVDYTYALDTLDRYDYQELTIEKTTPRAAFHATYENAMEVIRQLHEKFGGSHAALPCHQEPFLQRWQQTYRCHAVPMVSQWQWHPLQ